MIMSFHQAAMGSLTYYPIKNLMLQLTTNCHYQFIALQNMKAKNQHCLTDPNIQLINNKLQTIIIK